ncbi:DUF7519 family protein [Halosimplex halophilum]|uniref:DUF7519 family protein n=1 Tax=Halosimplex halophilum TaxID=2559572 RepID=UPI00107FC24B|nr:hypothetical protein [Halosimplex halophilum]
MSASETGPGAGTGPGPAGATDDVEPADREAEPEPSDGRAGGSGARPETARPGRAGASVDRSPARTSAGVAVALAAVAALWLPSIGGRALGLVGTALVGFGAVRGGRQAVTAGAVALVAGVAAAGLAGAAVVPLVGATLCTLLAWDAGRYGITVGEQLGRGASTTRLELAHVTATAAVGTAAAVLGSVTYLAVDATTDGVAVVVLLVGVGLLVSALR